RQTPTGLAIALDSARLLNSPEHAAETVRLEKAAVEARAALGSLCYDLEDPGTAALGALHMLTQATVWTETGPDFAADALAQHDAKVLHEAQDRVAELEAELAEYERPADEDPIAYALTEHAEVLADRYRAEVLAEVTTWLVKKAREFRAMGGEMRAAQADAVAAMASKVERGAVRPDNLRMLPAG